MEPICGCDVNDVIFECGSTIVIVMMEVSDDVSVSQLLVDFQTQARNNLLPPYDVDLSSMSLTFTMTSNGKFRFIKKTYLS